MLAALGIVITLAVTIESPIINLLATATALVRCRASYELVRRFTVHWMIFLTAVSVLVAWTPLFDLVVRRWLETPEEVARWVRPGLMILALWSAAIAWRRFLQGVMIRFRRTDRVARGTVLRLASTTGTAVALLLLTDWPGIHLGATALMAGVLVEALYATLAARPILRRLEPAAAGEGLTYRRLFWFHLPLAGTAALTLLAQPLVTSTLARLPRPTLALAAWPLIFHATLVLRAPALSLPEAVIALTRGEETRAAIRRFSLTVAGVALAAAALFAATPLARLYLAGLQDATPDVAELARLGLLLFIPYPAISTVVAWVNGLLIHAGRTRRVNEAMAVNVAATAAILGAGLALGWPGIPTAAAALNAAVLAQLVYLWWRRRAPAPASS
jgi:hypothetical protein